MHRRLRRPLTFLLLTSLAAVVTPAFAQAQKLEPLPAIPPQSPEMAPVDAALEPQVTIRKRDRETVEEFRIAGRLYMIKVTPEHGVPYYLVDDVGNGNLVRRDSLDSGVRPPMWVIKEF